MSAAEITDTDHWGPLPLRWRHVVPGDVVITGDGEGRTAWVMLQAETFGRTTRTVGVSGRGRHSAEVDPDAMVTVLVPLAMREAIRLARTELGAQVHARA